MRKNQGITLIALIITIIVMLILVAVSVNILIKSNLIGTAEKAGDKYKTAYEEEAKGGTIEIDGKKYNSIDDYMEEISPTIVEGDPNDWDFKVEEDDTITITEYKNTDTTIDTVVVPNYIEGKPVKRIGGGRLILSTAGSNFYLGSIWNNEICTDEYFDMGSMHFKKNITIKKVVISPGIENILSDAFAATVNLSEISIPSSVTNMGVYAFCGCTSLKEIVIPNNVTNIGYSIFDHCSNLTKITIPNSVTTMGSGVFSGIPSITVHVPWKEGEKPDGWDKGWNGTTTGCTVTIDYVK